MASPQLIIVTQTNQNNTTAVQNNINDYFSIY